MPVEHYHDQAGSLLKMGLKRTRIRAAVQRRPKAEKPRFYWENVKKVARPE
jgi:hypothetical protein